MTHKPTAQTKKIVKELAAIGLNQVDIADAIGLGSDNTLRKYYDEILRTASIKNKKKLATTAWQKAIVDKDTTMIIFLCKTQLGWKERQITELEASEDFGTLLKNVLTQSR